MVFSRVVVLDSAGDDCDSRATIANSRLVTTTAAYGRLRGGRKATVVSIRDDAGSAPQGSLAIVLERRRACPARRRNERLGCFEKVFRSCQVVGDKQAEHALGESLTALVDRDETVVRRRRAPVSRT